MPREHMIAGVILAAGEGRRFAHSGGGIKQLARLDGKPLLQHALDAQLSVSGLQRVIVVLGAHAQTIQRQVPFGRAQIVVCSSWDRGPGESLRAALVELEPGSRALITLGDQPYITPLLIERFLDAPAGTRAAYHGHPGHPVVLGPEQIEAVLSASTGHGARELLPAELTVDCTTFGPDLGADIDTVEDLTRGRR